MASRIDEYLGPNGQDPYSNVRFIRAARGSVLNGRATGGFCLVGHPVAAGRVLASFGGGWVCYDHAPALLRNKMREEVRRVDALEHAARKDSEWRSVEAADAAKVFGIAESRQARPKRGGLA